MKFSATPLTRLRCSHEVTGHRVGGPDHGQLRLRNRRFTNVQTASMVFSAVHVMLLSRTTGPPSQTMLGNEPSHPATSRSLDTSVPVGNARATLCLFVAQREASGVTPVAVKANFWPLDWRLHDLADRQRPGAALLLYCRWRCRPV